MRGMQIDNRVDLVIITLLLVSETMPILNNTLVGVCLSHSELSMCVPSVWNENF